VELEEVFRRFDVSRESEQKLRAFVDLLSEWQGKMNLVSKASMANVWTRHVADSLQLLRLMPRNPQIIADLGSGAGFPGLILALAGPPTVHLYESIGKKAIRFTEKEKINTRSPIERSR
jgi:16S rRNA (guanine527-N7)-methyltransferase